VPVSPAVEPRHNAGALEHVMSEPPGSSPAPTQVIPVADLREYFSGALDSALAHQRLSVDGQTQHYVVNLLTLFSRADALYEQTAEGAKLRPLVVMLTQALEAPTEAERQRALQRMGDVSLFVAGFFARSFARKLIDIDYHISMGGNAYRSLAHSMARGRRAVLGNVFAELATKFQPLVDALNEISETAYQHSQRDLLRLYEMWVKTGSPRAHRILRQLGVTPGPGSLVQH
jgi:hypothetical protein